MGDWTPSSPKVIPAEWRPRTMRQVAMNGAATGLAMRIRPGAVTLSHLHLYLSGGTPDAELAAEVVNSLTPSLSEDASTPSTDQVVGGSWVKSSGSASFFTYVDDWVDTADWLRVLSGSVNGARADAAIFRGTATALSSVRVRYVEVQLALGVDPSSGLSGPTGALAPVLDLGGVMYSGTPIAAGSMGSYNQQGYRWYTNPATGKPWTLAEANTLRTAGTNGFGAVMVASGGVNVIDLFSVRCIFGVTAENRVGGWFTSNIIGSDLSEGWRKYALTGAGALSANTWYWLVIWSPQPDVNGFAVPVLQFPETNAAASAAATVGEHRQVLNLTVDEGGQVLSQSATVGEILPALFDSSGTIRSQSAPYAEVDATPVYSGSPAAQLGQEVTTSGVSTAYGAVRIACGYQTQGVTPNASLLVKVRTTSFTGTVQATATIAPLDVPGAGLQDVQQDFDVVYTPPTATKIFVTVESDASAGAGWQVVVVDQRSDLVTTTTAAEVQGAGFGGTTDAASPASSTRDQRYDLAVALVSAPSAPAGFTATPAVAV